MKKISLMCLLAVLIGSKIIAQAKTSGPSFSIGYGIPNIPALALSTDIEKGFLKPFGPFIVSVNKNLSKRISGGLQIAFSKATSKLLTGQGSPLKYRYNITFGTILLRSDYHYLVNKKVDLYSGIAGGYYILKAKAKIFDGSGTPPTYADATNGFAWHLNAFGIKLNISNNWGFISELGFGYNGILNLGIFKTL